MAKNIFYAILIGSLFLAALGYGYFVSAALPPIANAGPDQYITLPGYYHSVTLQGSGSDPNGSTISFSWWCNDGYLYNSNTAQPVFTIPSSATSGSPYTCNLTITNNYGLSASDSVIIYVNNPQIGGQGGTSGLLTVNKFGRNLSSGNLNWSNYVSASPSDVLQFRITVQATGSQTANNVILRDYLPANLIFYNNLTVDGLAFGGSIASGINLGSMYSGQTKIVVYQAQVAPAQNFAYGATTLTNSVSVTSNEGGSNQALSNVSIAVNRTGLLGATDINTGLTNNLLTDSFFPPLAAVIFLLWILFKKRSKIGA